LVGLALNRSAAPMRRHVLAQPVPLLRSRTQPPLPLHPLDAPFFSEGEALHQVCLAQCSFLELVVPPLVLFFPKKWFFLIFNLHPLFGLRRFFLCRFFFLPVVSVDALRFFHAFSDLLLSRCKGPVSRTCVLFLSFAAAFFRGTPPPPFVKVGPRACRLAFSSPRPP